MATAVGKATMQGEERSVLSGAVVSQKGAPQVGVPVTLFRGNTLVGETVTGAQGDFRFEKLRLGAYTVVVPEITVAGIALDGIAARNIKLTQGAATGRRYVPIKQRLLPEDETGGRRLIYGIVSDASGAGLNNIKVRMSWTGADPSTEFPVEVTGRKSDKPAGFYEFVTTQGMFSVTVAQGDWPSDASGGLETAHVLGREGQPISYEVDFQLQTTTRPAHVEGVASGAQPGRRVTLSRSGSDARAAALDADLRFAFPDLLPGNYRLELEGVGVIADNIVLDAGRLYKLLFPLQSTIVGQVEGARAGAIIVLRAPPIWGWTRQALLDEQGRFAFSGLPAGDYRLQMPGADALDFELNGENRLELPPIDLTAGQRGVLRGRVASRSGQPEVGVELTLLRDNASIATMHTDADGAYYFAHLPAGTYSLRAAGMGEVLRDLILDGKSEVTHDIIWLLGTLAGRVLTAAGTTLAGQTVLLQKAGMEVARVDTGADGAFRFAALAPGVYTLALADGAPVVSGLEVAEGSILHQDLTLPANKLFAYYLLFPAADGELPDARVTASLALALTWRYLRQTGAAGGFSLDEATQAAQVMLVGRHLSSSDEAALKAAGCQVNRLPEDIEALAAALERLSAQAGEG